MNIEVSEKCPDCGHLGAYSKEMQVRLPTRNKKGREITVIAATERGRGIDGILHGKVLLFPWMNGADLGYM